MGRERGLLRNVAAVGTVDTGKTTLTDYVMSLDLAQQARGSIERGDTRTDVGVVERSRGITITTVPVQGRYVCDGIERLLTIVDTPGHPEFRYQVRTGLDGVEGVLFLVDLHAGMTHESAGLVEEIRRSSLPMLVALNKVDLVRPHEYARALARIEHALGQHGMRLSLAQEPIYAPDGELVGIKDHLLEGMPLAPGHFHGADAALLRGALQPGEVPAVLTSGMRGIGGLELLSYAFAHVPPPNDRLVTRAEYVAPEFDTSVDFSARVINKIPQGGSGAGAICVRIASGQLAKGDRVSNSRTGEGYAVRHMYGVNREPRDNATAGDIVLLTGLDRTRCASGDTLHGAHEVRLPAHEIRAPIITTELSSPSRNRLVERLRDIARWDPSYRFEPSAEGARVASSGTFHLGVLIDLLRDEFGLSVSAKPFAPRYVAAPAHEGLEITGTASSREESYRIRISVNPDRHPHLISAMTDQQNRFSAHDRDLQGLVRDLQSLFSREQWFDHFPLAGFNVQLLEAHGSHEKVRQTVKHRALQETVDQLLYSTGSVALFEPYLRFQAKLDNAAYAATLSRFLNARGLHTFSVSSEDVQLDMPLLAYLTHEEAFLKELRGIPWEVAPLEYRPVPYEQAMALILATQQDSHTLSFVCESGHAQVRRREHPYGRATESRRDIPSTRGYVQPLREEPSVRPRLIPDPSRWAGGPR